MSNDQVSNAIKETLVNITVNEVTKMLTLKGWKKADINQITDKLK